MKRSILRHKFALWLIAALTLASCSQDELAEQGTALPEGMYPLTFTVGMKGMTTRANGKEDFTENDHIGVRLGNGSNAQTGEYIIATGNTVQPASTEETIYWQSTAPATVTAWYPYASTTADISDQSDGYATFDFLRAQDETSYDEPLTLSFIHRMAKVKYILTAGEGLTGEDLSSASVTLGGYTQATFSEGEVTGQTEGWIKPYATDDEALLIPQNMTGKPFIKVSVTVDGEKRDFVYTPTGNVANLESGCAYTYDITVKRTGIEVSSLRGKWSDNEENGDAKEAVFRVYLPEGHGQTLTYSDNVKQEADYLEVNGNPFTISYSPTDDTRTKGFPITDGKGTVARTATTDGKTYTFTYNLRTDARLEYSLYVEAGDYYYEDNTWLPYRDDSKTCIGIVFKSGAGTDDTASNYGDKLTDEKIHGYVVALQDAHEEIGIWGIRNTDVSGLTNEARFSNKYNGYTNTQTVKSLSEYEKVDPNRPASGEDQYWAFKVASDYTTKAPEKSSGWYLPSIGQLQDIYNLPDRTGLLIEAGGSDFRANENDGRYWSSTEYNNLDAWYYRFNGNGPDAYAKGVEHTRYCYVRAVLTF